MAASLLGVALGMVLVASCAALFHAELAGNAHQCTGELHWAALACVSTGSGAKALGSNLAPGRRRACVLCAAWLHRGVLCSTFAWYLMRDLGSCKLHVPTVYDHVSWDTMSFCIVIEFCAEKLRC